jgi:hypothetical protein
MTSLKEASQTQTAVFHCNARKTVTVMAKLSLSAVEDGLKNMSLS